MRASLALQLAAVLALLAAVAVAAAPSAKSAAAVAPATVGPANPCPANCSYPQGQCATDHCACASGFAGADCSYTVAPLTFGQIYTVTLPVAGWQYYSFTVPADKVQCVVNMERTSATGDPDLYVKKGTPPTLNSYDFADLTTATEHAVDMREGDPNYPLSPGFQYFVGVSAFGSMGNTFELHVEVYSCPNDCSGHGTCSGGQCQCQQGWILEDCSEDDVALTVPFDTQTGALEPFEWDYFHVVVDAMLEAGNADYFVQVNRTSTDDFGYLDLYVAFNQIPTDTVFDYSSTNAVQSNSLKICNSALMQGVYWIAIRNWGFGTVSYQLSARTKPNCPNACSGNGICSAHGLCGCAAGYSGLDCSVNTIGLVDRSQMVGGVVASVFIFLIVGIVVGGVLMHFQVIQRIYRAIKARRGMRTAANPYTVQSDVPTASAAPAPAADRSNYSTF